MIAADQIVQSAKKVLANGGRPHTTIGASSRSTPPRGTISWKSSKSAMADARPSSRRNFPSTAGTKLSAIRLTRTPSWTVWSTTPTASNSLAKACAELEQSKPSRLDRTLSPVTKIHRPARLATRAASSRYGGRHHPGIPGRHYPVLDGRNHRNPRRPAHEAEGEPRWRRRNDRRAASI